MKQFSSKVVERSQPIEFELDGATYSFQPGKRTDVLMAMLVPDTKGKLKDLDRTSQLLNWFSNGLNKDHNEKHDSFTADCQACDVEKRLKDPDDILEAETVLEATMWLIGESAGGKATSSS